MVDRLNVSNSSFKSAGENVDSRETSDCESNGLISKNYIIFFIIQLFQKRLSKSTVDTVTKRYFEYSHNEW